MTFTYYGHACFLITLDNGSKLLFDPFISPNELAKNIDVNAIECDYILISHAHGDHVADAVAVAKRTGAKMIGVYEVMGWFEKQGIANCHPMNTGGSFAFDFGRVKLTNAIHSSQFPDGTWGGNPVGFIITTKEGRVIHYSGDTALTMDMKILGDFYKPDVAILPIGDNFTMGYHDATIAAGYMKVTTVIGVHYDTFPWIKINHAEAVKHFANAGKALLLPGIGETIAI